MSQVSLGYGKEFINADDGCVVVLAQTCSNTGLLGVDGDFLLFKYQTLER